MTATRPCRNFVVMKILVLRLQIGSSQSTLLGLSITPSTQMPAAGLSPPPSTSSRYLPRTTSRRINATERWYWIRSSRQQKVRRVSQDPLSTDYMKMILITTIKKVVFSLWITVQTSCARRNVNKKRWEKWSIWGWSTTAMARSENSIKSTSMKIFRSQKWSSSKE